MARNKIITAVSGAALIAVIIAVSLTWKAPIDPVTPSNEGAFTAVTLQRGSDLAAIGNCVICHTAPGKAAYAGSRALPTPFGTIYSSNITPDPETGIGRWSEAAFRRALREGVDRAGNHLYPAFPYDHFTQMTDEDIHALYAFIISRDPVRNIPPENKLSFPFNIRPLLVGWKLLFLTRGPRESARGQSEELNRGSYLAEAVGHCGACHTPRNFFGAEQKSRPYAGGESEGWDAPALDPSSRAPTPWSAEQLFSYLRTGWQSQHGASAGPMAPVTVNLAAVPESDVRALSRYIESRSINRAAPQPFQPVEVVSPAAAIYAGACATCHDATSGASLGLPLSISTSLREARPRNVLHILLNGINHGSGTTGPFMPPFDGTLTDSQLVELTAYIRNRFSGAPAWRNIGEELATIRKGDPS